MSCFLASTFLFLILSNFEHTIPNSEHNTVLLPPSSEMAFDKHHKLFNKLPVSVMSVVIERVSQGQCWEETKREYTKFCTVCETIFFTLKDLVHNNGPPIEYH